MKPTQASTTAKVIAASTLLLASDASTRALVAPGAVDLSAQFLSGTFADRVFAASARWPPTRALWRRVDRYTLPGITEHFWHRKQWIERRCRDALAEGFERVIVLGAGFDTLGMRLCAEFPQVRVVEIDHPATQEAKRAALVRGPLHAPPNLELVPLDLGGAPLPPGLEASEARTVVIAEGLLMYLPRASVERLFDAVRGLPARDLRFVFSYIAAWPDGSIGFRPRSRLIDRWLAWRGEPFRWALDPRQLDALLAAHRLRLLETASSRAFSGTTASDRALEGEFLVACTTA